MEQEQKVVKVLSAATLGEIMDQVAQEGIEYDNWIIHDLRDNPRVPEELTSPAKYGYVDQVKPGMCTVAFMANVTAT